MRKILNSGILLVISIGMFLIIASCSQVKNPVDDNSEFQNNDNSVGSLNYRQPVAVYDVTIDPATQNVTLVESNRIAAFHLPLTSYYPNVLKITGYGWTPNFWADIKLSHPFPGSGIDAFDPRVIAILPANPGVSFNYPVFNVTGNHSVVLEPDGYTKLFDSLGGSLPGNTNPFKAYFKNQPNRRWSSTGTTSETQRWNMKLTGFGGPIQYKLVVDVSTNYPNPPQPVIDNAPEPVEIQTQIGDGLFDTGGNANIEVTLTDWQGSSGTKCKVEAPNLFNSAVELNYSTPGPNPNEYIFSGIISNSLLAPAGEYKILIATWDIATDVHMFNEATAIVLPEAFNLKDITPPWLITRPQDITIAGNYAYVADEQYGLFILDLSNPANPSWTGDVDTPGIALDVFVSGNYAYVADSEAGLEIIDVSDPQSPYIVKTIDTSWSAKCVKVTGGYAYVADDVGIQIIDIDPINSAYIVKMIPASGHNDGIDLSNGYAFVISDVPELQIFDVDPVSSAYLATSLMLPDKARDIFISGNYAYITGNWAGLIIVDISSPLSANIVKTVSTPTITIDVWVSGDFAYVSGLQPGLSIIDINPFDEAHTVGTVNLPEYNYSGVAVKGDYAYIAGEEVGIQVIDINPPESPFLEKSAFAPVHANGLAADSNYLYASDLFIGMQVVDITSPRDAFVAKTVYTSYSTVNNDVRIYGGYAYLSSILEYFVPIGALEIIDINVPQDAYILNTVSPIGRGFSSRTDVSKGYAYFNNDQQGLYIVSIEPPQSASIINNVAMPAYSNGLKVLNGYVYSANGQSGLNIIDVEPPGSAALVKNVDTPGDAWDVDVADGYAYVSDGANGLQIIDIDPIDQASIVKTVDTPGKSMGIYISGGFAFIADYDYGLQIIDIDPPLSAHIETSISSPGAASEVCVSGNYGYVACGDDGLQIVKLR